MELQFGVHFLVNAGAGQDREMLRASAEARLRELEEAVGEEADRHGAEERAVAVEGIPAPSATMENPSGLGSESFLPLPGTPGRGAGERVRCLVGNEAKAVRWLPFPT